MPAFNGNSSLLLAALLWQLHSERMVRACFRHSDVHILAGLLGLNVPTNVVVESNRAIVPSNWTRFDKALSVVKPISLANAT